MNTPPDGPLGRNLFIRNAQPIGNGVFLAEGQTGRTGKGKVWRMCLVRAHPEAGTPPYPNGTPYPDWQEFGIVKPAQSSWRKSQGQWGARLYGYFPGSDNHRWVESFFESEARAVQFLVLNATEFFK
jgi:hypothetical protein